MRGDTGLHNKPLGCGASEVYALGPACEEEEERQENKETIAKSGFYLQ